MEILRPGCDPERFFGRLARATRSALLLDYDGTLAPLRRNPERAVAYPGVYTILDEMLARGRTRVVVVSGRPAAELVPLLPLKRQPEIWGAHGWERLTSDGRAEVAPLAQETREALDEAQRLIADIVPVALRCEVKHASVAVHWRGLSSQLVEWVRQAARDAWVPLAQRSGLRLREFDGGIELCASGRDKGDAVETVIEETGGDFPVAYLGDDATDEDAFAALCGRGLTALVAHEARPTAADVLLKPPAEVLDFLVRWTCARDRA